MYEPGIVVRPPREEDVEALADLIYRFYRFNEEFDPAWSMAPDARERARSVAESYVKGEGKTLVAVHDGVVIGYIHGSVRENPMLERGRQAVITELYVKPQHRGRGVATMLVEELARLYAREGVTVVTAEFPTANFVAESFYKAKGFRPYTSIYIREVEG